MIYSTAYPEQTTDLENPAKNWKILKSLLKKGSYNRRDLPAYPAIHGHSIGWSIREVNLTRLTCSSQEDLSST